MKYEITTELFVIPDGKSHIVYSPFKRFAFQANRHMIMLLGKIKRGEEIKENADIKKVLNFLKRHKIVNGPKDHVFVGTKETKFHPTSVTLLPTSDCNLRCVYCYSNGGEKREYMDWEVAKAAIDTIVENAMILESKRIHVGFHGGGEPTIAWETLTKSVDYARKLARKNSIKIRTSMATNCSFDERKRDWVVKNMNHVNVSFDGPKNIHDTQRQFADKTGSFDVVFGNMKYFDKIGYSYGIRTTVTRMSVKRMTDIVKFIHRENLSASNIHFEPLFSCGRCSGTKWTSPDPEVFVREFNRASEAAEKCGIDLYSSSCRIEKLGNIFCGACGTNFCPTPDGHVTSCYEVSSSDDPKSGVFFYGKYNKKRQKFEFDRKKLDTLRKRTTENMESCAGCFSKWHCCGDCLSKAVLTSGSILKPCEDRCIINRGITKYYIKRLLQGKKLAKSRLSAEIIEC